MNVTHALSEIFRLWSIPQPNGESKPLIPDDQAQAIVARFRDLDIHEKRCTVILEKAVAKPQGPRPVKDVVIAAFEQEQAEKRGFSFRQPTGHWPIEPVSETAREKAAARRAREKAEGLGVDR